MMNQYPTNLIDWEATCKLQGAVSKTTQRNYDGSLRSYTAWNEHQDIVGVWTASTKSGVIYVD